MEPQHQLVTIAIPIYKRLQYLPHILGIVDRQDYPEIELIVSDNGLNSPQVRDIVASNYRRPYRFRQNSTSVGVISHFNQIINEASGEYFVLLADDDEISPNYVSELVRQLKCYPSATVAIARQESFNDRGEVTRRTRQDLPDVLSGPEFIRAVWPANRFNFECFSTFLAKTEEVRRSGGYPEFTRGNQSDNALLIKMCLGGGSVAFSMKCVFRWRVDASSLGWSVSSGGYAAACRQFMHFLDQDPILRQFAMAKPKQWQELRALLVRMAWESYFYRWKGLYRERLSRLQWTRAAFVMPLLPAYYRSVAHAFLQTSREALAARVKKLLMGTGDSTAVRP